MIIDASKMSPGTLLPYPAHERCKKVAVFNISSDKHKPMGSMTGLIRNQESAMKSLKMEYQYRFIFYYYQLAKQ